MNWSADPINTSEKYCNFQTLRHTQVLEKENREKPLLRRRPPTPEGQASYIRTIRRTPISSQIWGVRLIARKIWQLHLTSQLVILFKLFYCLEGRIITSLEYILKSITERGCLLRKGKYYLNSYHISKSPTWCDLWVLIWTRAWVWSWSSVDIASILSILYVIDQYTQRSFLKMLLFTLMTEKHQGFWHKIK